MEDRWAVLFYDKEGHRQGSRWNLTMAQALAIMEDPRHVEYVRYLHPDTLQLAPPQLPQPVVKTREQKKKKKGEHTNEPEKSDDLFTSNSHATLRTDRGADPTLSRPRTR